MAERKRENFAFEHEGLTYWYSRSLTTVGYVFCKGKSGKWCVLANKRGPGCPTDIGKWNVPCGYIEHGTNAVDNCLKEIKEESGLVLMPENLIYLWTDTRPDDGKQNMDMTFYAVLPDKCSSYKLSDEYSEPDEVSDIKWIPINELDDYEFAFNQKTRIYEIYYKYIKISWLRRIILCLTQKLMKKFIFKPIK